MPAQTKVIDPLGQEVLYTLGRDTVSRKPRLEKLQGDCPACGVGPNATLFYDPAHPLLPARSIHGREIETQYAYNARGRMTSRTEAAGTPLARTTTWQYGNASFPAFATRVETPSTSGGSALRTTVLSYNAAGDLDTRTVQGADDALNRLTSVTQPWAGAGGGTAVTSYGYDVQDHLVRVTDETRSFNNRYFPSGITLGGLLNWTYSTDAVGNILSITDTLNAANNRSYGYQDNHYFLTQGNGPWGPRSWTYDRIGNRLAEARGAVTDTYSYLSNGTGRTPILSQVQLGTGGTRTYQFGPAGHLERTATGAASTLFLNDDAGRLAALEGPNTQAGATFRYDGRDYLSFADSEALAFLDSFETGDVCAWSGAIGLMSVPVCTIRPAVRATYSSEGLLHALHRNVAPQSSFVFHFAGRPVAQLDISEGTESWKWLTTDHLGTPIAATSPAGTLLWQGSFEPFGADWSGAGGVGVFLRFPGQWEEGVWENASQGTGLYYNVHRWYERETGRYTKPDPLSSPSFIESLPFMEEPPPADVLDIPAYIFAEGTPTKLVDELGLIAFEPFKTCFVTSEIISSSEPAGEGNIPTPFGRYHYQRRRITGRICFFRCYCDRKDNCPRVPCFNAFCPLDHGIKIRHRYFDKKGVRPCKSMIPQVIKEGKCPPSAR